MKRKAKHLSIYKIPDWPQPLSILALLALTHAAYADPKVFHAVFKNDVLLERVYESKAVELLVTRTSAEDHYLNDSVLSGEAGFDAITGRMIIELNQLTKSGMPMKIVGFVLDKDQEKGLAACTEWQTRMFENSKLCYSAEIRQGQEVKAVVSIDDFNSNVPKTNPSSPGLAADKRP